MRILIVIPALAALAGCQVSKDNANDTVTASYNQDVAQNAAADVGNTAQNIAADVGNDVKATGDKIDNRIGDHDADNGNAASNSH